MASMAVSVVPLPLMKTTGQLQPLSGRLGRQHLQLRPAEGPPERQQNGRLIIDDQQGGHGLPHGRDRKCGLAPGSGEVDRRGVGTFSPDRF
jgi:hypothetical protein